MIQNAWFVCFFFKFLYLSFFFQTNFGDQSNLGSERGNDYIPNSARDTHHSGSIGDMSYTRPLSHAEVRKKFNIWPRKIILITCLLLNYCENVCLLDCNFGWAFESLERLSRADQEKFGESFTFFVKMNYLPKHPTYQPTDDFRIFLRNSDSWFSLTRWCRSVQAWTFFAFFRKKEGVPLN